MSKKTAKTPPKNLSKSEVGSNQPKKATASQGGSREDRNDHRVPIQMLVDYKTGGNYLFDFCRDLGTGGVFIESKTPLSVGSDLELTFTIPDSKETLRTSGKVIWSQPPVNERQDITPGMGVQFANFSESNRKTLDQFIARYGSQRGEGPHKRKAS